MSGSDVILTVGSGKITIKNGSGKKLSLYNNSNSLTTTVIGGSSSTSTLLTVTNSTKSPVTVSSSIKTIDASKRTTAVKITGNSSANTIKGGSKNDTIYGGSGNDSIQGNTGNDSLYGDAGNDKLLGGEGADTLIGGKGNDTLTGNAGKDVFVYASGGGNDVITDYTAGQDKIKITGAKISKTSVSNSDVILTVGSGSIKIKDGKGKSLSIYNNSSSAISTVIGSRSYEEHWFLEDDDFVTSEVDSILNKDSKLISTNVEYNMTSVLGNPAEENLLTSNNYNQSNKKIYSSK